MEWKNVAFDWNHARAFLATAEEGSFSAAARALGLAQPTLGRQVAALEAELDVALFERVGHQLVLTEAGADLVDHVRAMNDAATRVSLTAAGQAQTLSGLVRIAASETVSAYVLPPIVEQLGYAHPDVEVELIVSNQTSDLRRREADIAVRHGRPKGDDLIARLILDRAEAHLYGAPAYLKRIGSPKTPQTLAERATVIGFDDTDTLLKGLQTLGYPFTEQSFPLRTDNHLVQWELAKHGLGLCMMMSVVGDREPRVKRALPKRHAGFPFSTWLTCHRELRTSRRIRMVYDLLAERLPAALS